jgi:hypothetical protein
MSMTFYRPQLKLFYQLSSLTGFVFACGGTPANPDIPKSPSESEVVVESAGDAPNASTGDPRSLRANATFKDLVNLVNRLDQQGLDNSPDHCLLKKPASSDQPWLIKADLAVAVRPLPEPPAELASVVRDGSLPITILSRWGRLGDVPQSLALAAFTTDPVANTLPSFVIFLTAEGIFLRAPNSQNDALPKHALTIDTLAPVLAEHVSGRDAVMYLTAEGAIPLSAFYETLASLPSGKSRIVIASPLPLNTRLPAQGSSSPSQNQSCPEGLPTAPDDSAEGSLATDAISDGINPLHQALEVCLSRSTVTASTSGKLTLALRIGREGRVERSCLMEDDVRDSTLTNCVLNAANQLIFPKPNPAGLVDVHLPLRVSPLVGPPQKPVCF